MERKTRFACRCRPFRGLVLALFALFGGLATAAQAMLLTLDLRWDANTFSEDPVTHNMVSSTYNLQEGSIIQVIGFKGPGTPDDDPGVQFGNPYGRMPNDDATSAAPYNSGHVPTDKDVWLANNTQSGHEILYTGSIQQGSTWYGLYTQITVDNYLYDTVYIRVFGATEIPEGDVVASYWGISAPHTNQPTYWSDEFVVENLMVTNANYFEVIPEPATLALLGLGGIALVACRRHRFVRPSGNGTVREED